MQSLEPLVNETFPRGHWVQPPAWPKVPAGHFLQEVELIAKDPALHFSHFCDPSKGAIFPTSQGVQLPEAFPVEKVPAGHLSQEVLLNSK